MLNSTLAQKQQTDKFVYKRKQKVRTPATDIEQNFSETRSAKKILVRSIYKPRYFCQVCEYPYTEPCQDWIQSSQCSVWGHMSTTNYVVIRPFHFMCIHFARFRISLQQGMSSKTTTVNYTILVKLLVFRYDSAACSLKQHINVIYPTNSFVLIYYLGYYPHKFKLFILRGLSTHLRFVLATALLF